MYLQVLKYMLVYERHDGLWMECSVTRNVMLCGVGCAVCSSWESHSPMYYYYTSTHAIGSPPPFISPPPLLLLLRYTFGPTFRAEQSHGTRHLAEFHMVRRKKMKREREKRREEKKKQR